MQHLIASEEVVHCNMDTLAEYLLSFICRILGSAGHKRCNVVHQTFHFCRASCCEWMYYLKEFVTRSVCVGPQIGMNPIPLWGLPNLEY